MKKKKPGNELSNKDNNIIINNQINESSEISEVKEKKNCTKHPGNNCDYFCIHCNKYYCSQCLIFFGSEVNKHKNHLIVPLSKLNDLGVNEALNEYEKLFETRDKMNNVIGLCNLKAKENEIKKYEMIKLLNSLQKEFIKKIDEKSQEIKVALNSSIKQKTYLEQKNLDNLLVNMFPNICNNNSNNPQNNNFNNNFNNFGNNFNNILMNNYNNNNYIQFFQTIRNLNQFENNFDITKKENTDINSKLYVENYETNFFSLTIDFPNNNNQNINGKVFLNSHLSIIPNYPIMINITFQNFKFCIKSTININDPINSPSFPQFYVAIFFRSKQYGIEFVNLTNKQLLNESSMTKHQTNSLEIDAEQFLYLRNEENKIEMKIIVSKTFYS